MLDEVIMKRLLVKAFHWNAVIRINPYQRSSTTMPSAPGFGLMHTTRQLFKPPKDPHRWLPPPHLPLADLSDTMNVGSRVPMYELKSQKELPTGVTPQMAMGVRAWSHYASRLASQGVSERPLTHYDQDLYEGVNEFAIQLANNAEFRSPHDTVFRASYLERSGFIDQFLEQSLTLRDIEFNRVVPYTKQFEPENSIITFSPVTSWTMYDLRIGEEHWELSESHPDIFDADVVFVARNSQGVATCLGTLSKLPTERELVTPQGTRARIDEAYQWHRPDRARPPYKKTGQFRRAVPRVVHILYITFIKEDPK